MKFEEYRKYDAIGLAKLITDQDVTPEELLEVAIRRTEEVNPALNAIVQKLYDHGRSAIAQGLPDGPFRGVPLLLKDTSASLAGTISSIGCRFLEDNLVARDGELIARYKRAGFVIFGKTNVPELEMASSTESKLHGPAKNPWNLEYSTGGSSGGAAAAVASGIVPAAHGGDGGGSIRMPSAHCGVFGLKPTRGRTPTGPMDGLPRGGLSAAHVLTQSVRDSAAILDASDGYEIGAPFAAPPKDRPFLDELSQPVRPLRIAMVTQPFIDVAVHPECLAAAESAAGTLRTLGHVVESAELDPGIPNWREAPTTLVAVHLRTLLEDHGKRLGKRLQPGDLEPLTAARLEQFGTVDAVRYLRAMKTIHAIGRYVAHFMRQYDLILTPATPQPPLRLGIIDMSSTDAAAVAAGSAANVGFSQLFNASGNPAASIPWTTSASGLPIGIQLVARFADEATIFRTAAQLESARPWRDRRPSL